MMRTSHSTGQRNPEKLSQISYYVDEAGDGVLFGPKGRLRIADPDAPRYFMLGMVQCVDDARSAEKIAFLRTQLMLHPLFRTIHSMKPEARKTAIAFHAKNDHPDVRLKVFETLMELDFRFFAVVKSMKSVLDYVNRRNQMHQDYRYHPNELYDFLVRTLFKQRLHQSENYRITFATRGNSARTEALKTELHKTRSAFLQKTGRTHETKLEINSHFPWEKPCLQIADYCLWALQRFYEKHESRFLESIWPKLSLIQDLDDPYTIKPYGSFYTRTNPLPSLEQIKNRWI